MGILALELVINNPYRILGVDATVSRKNLTKRINDLEMFTELGKIKTYPLDLSNILSVKRSLDDVKEAARNLESDENKLMYSFFWFLKHDAVDELALECLSNNEVDKAYSIWSQQIEKLDDPKFSWRLNRNVISFFRMEKYGFNEGIFSTILEDIGYVIDDHLDELKERIWEVTCPKIDDIQLWKKVVDNLCKYIDSLPNMPYGQYRLEIISKFWSFPQEAKDYLESRLFTPCIELIEEKIQYSENLRSQKKIQEFRGNSNNLKKLESLVFELAQHSESYKIQNIINEYANEIRMCSIFAYNEMDDIHLANGLIEWVSNLPVSGQVQDDIEENKLQLQKIVLDKKNEEQYANIINNLEREIGSLFDAEQSVNLYMRELEKIPEKNVTYIQISSTCVNVILNYLIDIYNKAQQEFSQNKDFNKLYLTAKRINDITYSLKSFTVDAELADRLNRNWSVINSEYNEIFDVKRKIESGQLKFTQKNANAVVNGTLGRIAESLNWNASFLRVFYVIVGLGTGVWPAIVLYFVLCWIVPKKG